MRAALKRLLPALLTLTLFAGAGPASAAPAATAPPYAEIDRYAEEQHIRTKAPGMAIAVVSRDGGVLHSRTWGTDGNGAPVTARTPFLLGSLAKPVAALAVMQLVEQKRLGLDDPVRRHLPWFRPEAITVRQLMTQTSGLSEDDGFRLSDRFDNTPGGVQRLARELADVTPVAPPGKRHEYSNANYMLLGALVEQLTGRPYGEHLHTAVLDPLGMNNAITNAEEASRAGLAPGHRYVFGSPRRHDVPFDTSGAPYGYIGANLDELGRFARAQLGSTEGTSVLSPTGYRLMHTGTAPVRTSHRYGLGWRDDAFDDLGTRIIWHGGATSDQHGVVVLAPERGLAVVVLHNAYAPYKDELLNATGFGAMRILLGGRPEPLPEDSWFTALLVALGVVAAALTAGAGWSVHRLRRPRRTPPEHRRRTLVLGIATTAACLLLAAGALFVLPQQLATNLRQFLLFAPDAGYLLLAVATLSVALGVLRTAVTVRTMRLP